MDNVCASQQGGRTDEKVIELRPRWLPQGEASEARRWASQVGERCESPSPPKQGDRFFDNLPLKTPRSRANGCGANTTRRFRARLHRCTNSSTTAPTMEGSCYGQRARARQAFGSYPPARRRILDSLDGAAYGVHRDTICRLLVKVGNQCRQLLDRQMRNLKLDHIQTDEIWTFCLKKQSRLTITELAERHDIGDISFLGAVRSIDQTHPHISGRKAFG